MPTAVQIWMFRALLTLCAALIPTPCFGADKAALDASIVPNSDQLPGKVIGLPAATKLSASFQTESDRGPDKLFDGDRATVITGVAGSCKGEDVPVWLDLKFPEPMANLEAIETGQSDKLGNYYPKAMEFWADSDGNGTFDTLLGKTQKLGAGDKSVGRHAFAGRLEKVFALRIRITQQNVAGLSRCFIMDEMRLVIGEDVPLIPATPTLSSEPPAPKPGEPAVVKPIPIGLSESLVPHADQLPGKIMPLPEGTKFTASFGTDKGRGPEVLFDGDLATSTNGAGGIVRDRRAVTSVTLKFPAPVERLGGIETGSSDPFRNYYPVEFEFWADSDGDGRCDTLLGRSRKLGPANECIGRHLFEGRLEKVFALEIRCVEQNVGGGGRPWSMNEMRLVESDTMPIISATPNSYRRLYFVAAMPEGTTATASFQTEDKGGPEALLDHDPTTFMNPSKGTARAGQPSSVFLRFPAEIRGLSGIVLGNSDPFNNYVWQEMEVYADTTGNGTYDKLAATFSGGAGERRFHQPVDRVFGLELRVTKQKIGGTQRAFMLSGINGLVFQDDPGDHEMRMVVEDFEDLSSWRTWATNTAQPEGERYYGGYTYLTGALRPESAHDGVGVGVMRYCFKPGTGNSMWATRGRVNTQEGIIDGIRFWANSQGYPCTISFEIVDAGGKKTHTPGVTLKPGSEWAEYSVDLRAAAFPAMAGLRYPIKLQHIFLNSAQGGTGDVLLDDITLVGAFDRGKRLRICPVYEGLALDPSTTAIVKYRLANALDKQVVVPLKAKLYSSFDPKHETALVTRDLSVTIPAFGKAVVPVEFGQLSYGHYQVELSVVTDEINVHATDEIAVLKLNGGRINQSPMWFGSQHPGGWIAQLENEFVFKNVVVPLGMDCYRVGPPDPLVYDNGMLMVAGFGGVPVPLRKPKEKNEDRGEPTDYEAYSQWIKDQARAKYLPQADKIIAVEFYNEPDLPGFGYLPEIDTYLKMHRVFAGAFREVIPGIKIGTGGNTVQHGKEKKDFNPRMYTELAKEADVAMFHAHGSLDNYVTRQRLVEQWQRAGGKSDEQMLLGNSEAGIPGGESPVGSLLQADTLVKKIGWAKAQRDSLFYCWFTTTDTYDPQGGYLNNENWGLITYNQRLKPSGQAYNELIRKLANTKGLGEVALDTRLQSCAYVRADGTKVWLSWPRDRGVKMLVNFAASAPVNYSDLFGNSVQLKPTDGQVSIESNGYPFYIEASADVRFGPAAAPTFAKFAGVLGVSPGSEVRFPVTLSNEWGKDSDLTVNIVDASGKSIAATQVNLPAGQQKQAELVCKMPASASYGAMGCKVVIGNIPAQPAERSLPLQIVIAEQAVKADGFKIDGVPDAVAGAVPIVVDKDTQVQDLAFDPNTPNWAGAADLSARATFAHDGKGLYVCIDVTDQTHKPGPADAKLWTGDSVQIAFYAGSAHTEIGLTEAGGGFGYVWISPDAKLQANPLRSPVAVKRNGDHTVYEAYLPFDTLGVQYVPATPIRMTFLVNEDDGRGRVRIAKWFDGISTSKDADRFGFLLLQ